MINWTKYAYKVEGKKTSRRKKKYTRPCHNVVDIYRMYRTIYPNKGIHHHYVKEFKAILYAYNKALALEILDGKECDMPYRMGKICIRKHKVNYKTIEKRQFTLRLNPYFLKPEADGFAADWFWDKKTCLVEGVMPYSFTPVYPNKAKLAKIMQVPNNYQRYYDR